MFLFKLMSFLLGYVTILVTGDAPEKFINMAASRGISLWDVARSGEGGIRLKVRLSAVKPLRHMARRTRCRFRICRREGLPFYFARLRQMLLKRTTRKIIIQIVFTKTHTLNKG
jgi:similar to stage IV sporulation protein